MTPNLRQHYFCKVGGVVEGPFNLIELAAQLRYARISGDTPLSLDGATEWRPFSAWPEFTSAQEIPIEEIAAHLEAKEHGQVSKQSPVKSGAPWGLLVGVLICLAVMVGVIAYATQDDTNAHKGLFAQIEAALGLRSGPTPVHKVPGR